MSDSNTGPRRAEELSPIEEEFFRAGDAISDAAPAEADPDSEPERRGVFSRLFKRKTRI
jgi:hypothetical protein